MIKPHSISNIRIKGGVHHNERNYNALTSDDVQLLSDAIADAVKTKCKGLEAYTIVTYTVTIGSKINS